MLTPHAVDRTTRRDAAGPRVAGASSATLVDRTFTRFENSTEVVHHRTSFEHPVTKVLRQDADARAAREAAPGATGATTTNPPVVRSMPAAPVIDVERLSDEVYRHIQRRVRIERERRGA